MTRPETLTYLAQYVAEPQLLSTAEAAALDPAVLPATWREFMREAGEGRCERVLAAWRPFRGAFEQTLSYLQTHLLSVDLLKTRRGYSLLYAVKAEKTGNTMYYEGRNPLARKLKPSVQLLWSNLPAPIQAFYELHDGWCYLAAGSLGPAASEDVFVLSEQDWGILDDLGTLDFDLKQTVALYTNGMGAYICYDLRGRETLLWFHNKAPKRKLEFWPLVDSWTRIGFEG